MKVFLSKGSILAGSVMIALFFIGWAKAPQKTPELGLCALKESQAYQQFLTRPVSEYSKALYLIERFKNLPHEIVYDGRSYKIKAVSGMVTAFLRFNYKKNELAKHWVLKYANRSIVQNEVIMLRVSNGRVYRAGDLLLHELNNLEKALAEPSIPAHQMEFPTQFNARIESAAALAPEAMALPAAAQ